MYYCTVVLPTYFTVVLLYWDVVLYSFTVGLYYCMITLYCSTVLPFYILYHIYTVEFLYIKTGL